MDDRDGGQPEAQLANITSKESTTTGVLRESAKSPASSKSLKTRSTFVKAYKAARKDKLIRGAKICTKFNGAQLQNPKKESIKVAAASKCQQKVTKTSEEDATVNAALKVDHEDTRAQKVKALKVDPQDTKAQKVTALKVDPQDTKAQKVTALKVNPKDTRAQKVKEQATSGSTTRGRNNSPSSHRNKSNANPESKEQEACTAEESRFKQLRRSCSQVTQYCVLSAGKLPF
jgi:hypothetical protein